MRIVFMGTPEFAVPSLKALVAAGHEVVGAITQPDRPAGRGHKLTACPVKSAAQAAGIPVFQFDRLKGEEGVACLRALAPELCVTAAFGQILSAELLSIPTYGTVNVHASLLPAYRGSAPINQCILCGEKVAGVTTMLTDIGMDTGAILLQEKTPIGAHETAGELTERLAKAGAALLVKTLAGYPFGDVKPVPQDERCASYQPMLKKEMGAIDWTRDSEAIDRQVRGMNPWPCAYTDMPEGRIKIYAGLPFGGDAPGAQPGEVVVSGAKEGLKVACGRGLYEITELQAPGGKRMGAKDYLRGKKIEPGTVFGKTGE